ncbi:MAG: hypothetical protein AAF827_03885 [Cyanobacteria bacterium P01_D01_bin.6]
MGYQLIASLVEPPEDLVLLPGEFFRETEFIIEVFSPRGERRGWIRAGYLARMFDIPGIGLTQGEVVKLSLERRKVTYSRSSEPFRLEFRPFHWVCDYTIQLWAKDPDPEIQEPITLTINGETFTFNGEGITFL